MAWVRPEKVAMTNHKVLESRQALLYFRFPEDSAHIPEHAWEQPIRVAIVSVSVDPFPCSVSGVPDASPLLMCCAHFTLMYLTSKGRNWGDLVNWDDLGKLYAAFICAWTLILAIGIGWLISNRNLPFIKIRNVPLALISTLFLHTYLVKICLAYTTNGHFLCSAEYWIMSIYLPFGIALFQAYLTQLRSLWEQQQRLIHDVAGRQEGETNSKETCFQRWRGFSRLRRSYCLIAAGMLLQLIVTSILYATTPTLQGDWSSYGKIPHAKGQALCRKSLPWVTSAFWQLVWSWFYGPYTLLKTRHIRDIHHWRLQIIVSVIAGLPGTPLWLMSLYLPQFKPVNVRFVPPMWLAPGIIIMQFVTIYVPIFEAWSSSRDSRRNLSLPSTGGSAYTNSYQSMSSPKLSIEISESCQSSTPQLDTRVYAMPSLRTALAVNPKPLLEFAATKEFSAENILFLLQVRKWHSAWSVVSEGGQVPATSLVQLFDMAVEIYAQSIHERTAEFPINIDGKIRQALDGIFEATATQRHPQASSNVFNLSASFARKGLVRVDSSDSEKTLWDRSITLAEPMKGTEISGGSSHGQFAIPAKFEQNVFDAAEKSIEYLVLTNTWQKFVRAGRAQ